MRSTLDGVRTECLNAGMAFLAGLLIGSFLNVCVFRHAERSFRGAPRSHCPHCGKHHRLVRQYSGVSFLLLRARCRHCLARAFRALSTGGTFHRPRLPVCAAVLCVPTLVREVRRLLGDPHRPDRHGFSGPHSSGRVYSRRHTDRTGAGRSHPRGTGPDESSPASFPQLAWIRLADAAFSAVVFSGILGWRAGPTRKCVTAKAWASATSRCSPWWEPSWGHPGLSSR